jgi:hypothetical protein
MTRPAVSCRRPLLLPEHCFCRRSSEATEADLEGWTNAVTQPNGSDVAANRNGTAYSAAARPSGEQISVAALRLCNLRTSCPALRHGCPVGVFGDVGAANSLPPCGGGPGRGVALTSEIVGLCNDSERSARPPSLPHKGGGNPRIQLVARIRVPRGANRVSPQRSLASPSCADFLNRTAVALCRASTPRSHHQLQKLLAASPRGWPGQARP